MPTNLLEAEYALSKIKEHNASEISKILAKIETRKKNALATTDLDAELKRAQEIADNAEARARANIEALKAIEYKRAQEQVVRGKAKTAKIEASQKAAARLSWCANGGDEQAFEAAWPSLRAEIVKAAAIANAASSVTRNNQIVDSL